MKNHIRVEEVSTLCHGPFHFTRDKQIKCSPRRGQSPKRDHSPKRDRSSKREQKKPTKKHLNYREIFVCPLNTSHTEVLAAIQGKKKIIRYSSPISLPPTHAHLKSIVYFIKIKDMI
jgi:hypothetical protein